MLTDNLVDLTVDLDHDPGSFAILIIDNEVESVNHLVQNILRPRGYPSQVARTGREALSLIRRNEPDLMLLNWHLPDMEGEELLQTLVETGRRVPSVVMATQGSERVTIRAFRLGARDYLIKPLEPDETIQAIRRTLTEGWGHRKQTRLVEILRQRLQRSVVLVQLAQAIVGIRRPDELLAQIVDAAILVTGAEEGFALVVDPETGALELRAMRGFDEENARLVRLPVGDSSARQVVETGKPLRIGGENESDFKVRTGYLVKGLVHVPIKRLQRVIGVLSVDRKFSTQPFGDEDEEMLIQLAGCAAVALENVRGFYEQEREWKAVTDNLRQQFTALRDSLTALADAIPQPDAAQRELFNRMSQAILEADTILAPVGTHESEP